MASAGGVEAYVALGTNLGDRGVHLERALAALRATTGLEVLRVSSVYETEPVGPPPQGRYLNAVVKLRARLAPRALLARLLAIELAAGRVRGPDRNAARTLDLDLLLYGERRIASPKLTVPHPRLHERAFVLEPLCEIAGSLVHPVLGKSIEDLAVRVRDPHAVRRWERP